MKANGTFARVEAGLGLVLGARSEEAGSAKTHPELGWLTANREARKTPIIVARSECYIEHIQPRSLATAMVVETSHNRSQGGSAVHGRLVS